MARRAVLSLLILCSQSPADAFLVHRALPARPTVIGRAACPAVCVGTELQAPTARRHAAMKMSIFDKALDDCEDVEQPKPSPRVVMVKSKVESESEPPPPPPAEPEEPAEPEVVVETEEEV